MISTLAEAYPVKTLCAVLDCPHSSFYYRRQATDDRALVVAIEQIHARWPFYGYRRLTAQLAREGWSVNSKVVRRLMKRLAIAGKVGLVRRSTTDSRHSYPRFPNLVTDVVAAYPNHIWSADITYLWLHTRFVYLAIVLDLFSRAVRGWQLSRNLSGPLTRQALQQALELHAPPAIHHSDQGVQYAARDYVRLLEGHQVQLSMAAVGQPTENAFAERFMRSFKEEHYDYSEYNNFEDAYQQIGEWIEHVYNAERIHSALGYLPPLEFEAAYYRRKLLIDL
jgi:transposase InsO family protein